MTALWPEVTAERYCPICAGDRRCKIAPDGGAVRCFRNADTAIGWRTGKIHPDGGATYHREGMPAPRRVLKARNKNAAAKLPADELHRAYSALINRLQLNALHRINLNQRGLSNEEITRREYRSMPAAAQSRADLAAELHAQLGDVFYHIPGFGEKDGKPRLFGSVGLLVPCRDIEGRIVACKVRNDRPSSKGQKYTYLSSKKHGGIGPASLLHVPLGVAGENRLLWADTSVVRLTEGELKADVAFTISKIPTISCGGVGTWRRCIELLKSLGTKTVRLAFDADCSSNPDVARPLLEAVRSLPSEEFIVELERWSSTDGKGVDDALAAGKPTEVLAGEAALAAAIEIAKTAGIDPDAQSSADNTVIDRVKEVLETGGAEQLYQNLDLLKEIAAITVADRTTCAAIRSVIREAGIPLRELDRGIKKYVEAAAAAIPPELARDATGGFFEEAGCICRLKPTMEGPKTVQLCNFTCRIVDETTRDDGAERQTVLGLQGQLDGTDLPRVEVPADKFAKLEWIIPAWGSDATVWPGEQRALPAAIQALSRFDAEGQPIRKEKKLVLCHSGWRNLNGNWCYLHSGVPITAAPGSSAVAIVDLGPPLSECRLPIPPNGQEQQNAVRASLQVLLVCPPRISYPLLAGVYRSVLGLCDFSLSLIGATGIQKSELAALAQQHFGAGFTRKNLPGSWSSTANSIERLAFLAKDMLLVVDDFAPHGSSADVQRYHRDADRVFRAVGNHSGRGRMRVDGTLRPAMPPQALILSTGEDVARGQSVRSRQLILEVKKGDVDLSLLTSLQQQAADGLLAASIAGFLKWLAPNYEQVRNDLKSQTEKVRSEMVVEGQHARTPGMVADLVVGFRYFLMFAESVGAINNEMRNLYRSESLKAIREAASFQDSFQQHSDPVLQFINLLSSGLATGRVYISTLDGQPPAKSPEAWGWRNAIVGTGRNAFEELRPQGKLIGWVEEDHIYLDPDASYAEAQRLATEQGESFAYSAPTLRRRLSERGLLAVRESDRGTTTIRKNINGHRRQVLCMLAQTLLGDPDSHEDESCGQSNGQSRGQVIDSF